jgi:hypothetical protein
MLMTKFNSNRYSNAAASNLALLLPLIGEVYGSIDVHESPKPNHKLVDHATWNYSNAFLKPCI